MAAMSSSLILARLHRSLLSSSNPFRPFSYSSCHHLWGPFRPFSYSTSTDYIKTLKSTDEKVRRDLQTEINRAKDIDLEYRGEVNSDYICPFEIVDNPGEDKLVFKRDLGTEKIEVEVKLEYKRMDYVVTILKEDGSVLKYEDTTKFEIEGFELEMRGIDHSFSYFVWDYLLDRYKREYLRFLNRVKEILD